MKLLTSITLILAFVLTSAFTNIGDTIPSVKIKSLDGTSVDIQDYTGNGKITVISFWATWCSPCKKELDTISKVYLEWQEKYNIELIAISIDDERSLKRVPKLVESKGWPYTILSDTESALPKALKFQTVPQTFLVDQDGEIVYEHSGYTEGDELVLEEKIQGLLK